ncbi:hypothetical protein MTO96_015737 [Rhipicephalus appendiculatus]
MLLRWAREKCSESDLVLKIDDDMFLSVWDLAVVANGLIFGIVSSPLQCCGEPAASGGLHATTVLPEVTVLMAALCGPAVSTMDATPRTPYDSTQPKLLPLPLPGCMRTADCAARCGPTPHIWCCNGPRSVITQGL